LEAISVFHWLLLSERYQGCERMATSDMVFPFDGGQAVVAA